MLTVIGFIPIGFAVAFIAMYMGESNGPFGVFRVLREWVGKPFTCRFCLSWWASLLLSLVYGIAIRETNIALTVIVWWAATFLAYFLQTLIGYSIAWKEV